MNISPAPKILKPLAVVLSILIVAGSFRLWRDHHPETATQTRGPQKNSAAMTQEKTAPIKSEKTGEAKAVAEHATPVTSSTESRVKIPSQDKNVATTPVTPVSGCYVMSFKHKVLPSHSSDDECSHHRNLIKLGRADANPASVCIRVNGTPVRHERVTGSADEFVIGPVAGPHDVITARFCVGQAKCHESCPYPKQEQVKKDEFLDAIGANDDDTDTGSAAQWQAGDAQKVQEVNQAVNGEIKKELDDQENAERRTAANQSHLEVFKDWINDGETTACGSRTTASIR